MHTDKDKMFTIGQFSALHEITKKTLMWYDEMDLLKPAVVAENGYRYYTYRQSSVLETILMLRELNISISEIKDFMKNRSAVSMEQLLREKMTELDCEIAHLKTIQKTLSSRHHNMTTLLNIDLSEISMIEKEKSYLAVVKTGAETPAETEIEMVIAETKKYQLRCLHDVSYGAMIDVERLYAGDCSSYSGLFIEMPSITRQNGLHVRPQGKYLRAFCKGNWDQLPLKYQEILEYAQKQGIKLTGSSYEMGINENVIDKMDDYITQIEIPIKTE